MKDVMEVWKGAASYILSRELALVVVSRSRFWKCAVIAGLFRGDDI